MADLTRADWKRLARELRDAESLRILARGTLAATTRIHGRPLADLLREAAATRARLADTPALTAVVQQAEYDWYAQMAEQTRGVEETVARAVQAYLGGADG